MPGMFLLLCINLTLGNVAVIIPVQGDDILKNGTRSKTGRIVRTICADILMTGLILVVFAFFHHVLPMIKSSAEPSQPDMPAPTAAVETVVAEEPTPTPESLEQDDRTEWQIRFSEHFSDTIVSTENSYKSPNVSIEIKTVTVGEGDSQNTYHVADIYIASIENFATYTANNELKYFSTQDALEMDAAANALVSMTGDFYSYQKSGLLVRNGTVYMSDDAYCDICVMYYGGTVETYAKGSYDKDEILAKNPYQIWNFGPMLLDSDGKAFTSFDISYTVAYANPRSAFGYYEPGHYCFVVVDGRQKGYSLGMLMPELAAVFEELGCTAAYNLDGGGSALMMFNHERYSQQSNGGDRNLGDILLIRETEVHE